MSSFIQGLDGDFFYQESLANNWEHLDCVSVADLPLPLGDLTNIYCPDPARKGQVVTAGQLRGDPGAGTTTIDRPLSSVANWLFERRCPFNGLVTWACDGIRTVPENYEVAAVLFDVNPTQVSLAAPVVRERGEDARILTPVELSYTGLYLVYHLAVNTISISNTAAANGIVFLPEQCESKCANARSMCEEGYMTLDGTLYDAEVKKTKNGTTWYQTADDPFEEGGDSTSPVVFTRWDGHRLVIARLSASTYLGAEISYTENEGIDWTNVQVSAIVGQTIGRHGLVAYGGRLYAACSGAYIYMSLDMGDTWTLVESGTTTDDFNALAMYSVEIGYAVGDNNMFFYTANGEDWYQRVGPAIGVNLLCVAVNSAGDVFVGAADGAIYRSDDGGQHWYQTDGVTAGAWRDFGVGSIDALEFDDATRYFGFLAYNTAAPVGTVYRSINGGATWRAPATGQVGTWNAGLNDIFICDQNHAFIVGEVYDGNTFIAQVEPG